MDVPILETKIQIPPKPHHITHRPRLVEALENAIPHHKLILLSTPAGYGKTTLLVQWAISSRYRVAWLSVSQEDNDLGRFFRYLLAAWEKVQPGIKESQLGLLLEGMTPDSEGILAAFINTANQAPDPLVFVIDDIHQIEEPSIHKALTFLLDHLPQALHFVLAGRSDPPLPLAHYRGSGELLEFRAGELQFYREETVDFLQRQMQLNISDDSAFALHDQLEGWIAGLQLSALSLQRQGEAVEKLVISGRHRFIADYLSEDVLSRLPEDQQRFLLQTSILERLCGTLCEQVTGAGGGQAMLEALERGNLFILPLDAEREWYRYHHVFAGYLREELRRRFPDEVAQLHVRAARWYLDQGWPEAALPHAVAGQDAGLVMQLGERYFDVKLLSGEFSVLKRWLDSLPEEWQSAYSLVGLYRAGLFLFTGSLEDGARWINAVEQKLASEEGEDRRWPLARVKAVRCALACFENDLELARAYADRALKELPANDHTFRAAIYHALGDTYRRNGHWEAARACYLKLLDLVKSPSYPIRAAHAFCALADLTLQQGRLRDSAAYWRKALAGLEQRQVRGSFPLPLIGWVHIRLGEILYAWNDLSEAWAHLSAGLERSELGGDVQAMIAGALLKARLELAAGDLPAADVSMQQVRPLVEQARFPAWTGRFERLQLDLWLAQGRLKTAVDWADRLEQSEAWKNQPESESGHLALARVLVARGDALDLQRAGLLLQPLIETEEREGRMGIQIEALALRALVHWRGGDQPGALISLERALRLAEPEGYLRLFVDLGNPMIRLLQEARSRALRPEYVDRLLAATGSGLSIPPPAGERLLEPLTPREQEILELVAAGLTNQEIAGRLVVSPETIKKHAASIYSKLHVRSRTQAAARARELGLLG